MLFLLGMVSVKKVKNRSAALSPWSALTAGRVKLLPWDRRASSDPIIVLDPLRQEIFEEFRLTCERDCQLVGIEPEPVARRQGEVERSFGVGGERAPNHVVI